MTKEMKSILESSYKGKEVIAYINELEEKLYNLNCMYHESQVNLAKAMGANKELSEMVEKLDNGNKKEINIYKNALALFARWAVDSGFGYDNIGELYDEYSQEIEPLGYTEGLIYIAKKEVTRYENIRRLINETSK